MAGSIIKKGKNKYFVRLYIGLENGKRKYHSKTIHGTKKDAERYLNEKLREKGLGEFVESTKETLESYLDRWLETSVKPSLAPSTIINYSKAISIYIKPQLGNIQLSKLNPLDIQEFYNKLHGKGLSSKTIYNINGVLSKSLNKAVDWGLIRSNPARKVDKPKKRKKEMKVLNPEQAKSFIEASVYSPHKALFSLLLTTGLRPSEALGLRWVDIDFKAKKLHVQRTLYKSGSTWSLHEPKTSYSRRSIPLSEIVIEDLLEHQTEQNDLKNSATFYSDHDFVFAGKSGAPIDYKTVYRKHFKRLLADACLPEIRLYDLRHTCATLLLSTGVNPKIVSERLGHSSVSITLDTYSHVLPDMQDMATEKIDDILFHKK